MSDESAWLAAVEPPPGGDLVVAISGGPDSAFLAWAMTRLGDPRLVHVHHGTPAADRLAETATGLAEKLGLSLQIVEVEVPAGPSWEDQARRVRSAALRTVAGDAPIATGHHRDDQAETVVANLLRGAGARGLAGMQVDRPGWIRPLLGMRREQIREAADSLGLPYMDDPANLDTAHTRALIRHGVLPALEEAAPGVTDRLAVTSALLTEDDAELEREASEVRVVDGEGLVTVSVHELRVVGVAVASRVVRRAIRAVHGVYPGSAADVAAVLGVVAGPSRRATITGGTEVVRDRADLLLRRALTSAETWTESVLTIPGRVDAGDRWISASSGGGLPTGPRRAVVSTAALTTADPVVRPVRSGDRIDIGSGSKLVSDALRESAVATHRRPMWPVVDVGGRIAWLAGVRVAAWTRPRDGEPVTTLETGVI